MIHLSFLIIIGHALLILAALTLGTYNIMYARHVMKTQKYIGITLPNIIQQFLKVSLFLPWIVIFVLCLLILKQFIVF